MNLRYIYMVVIKLSGNENLMMNMDLGMFNFDARRFFLMIYDYTHELGLEIILFVIRWIDCGCVMIQSGFLWCVLLLC